MRRAQAIPSRCAARRGTQSRRDAPFGALAAESRVQLRPFVFRYRTPQHWLGVFRTWYGPVPKAFAALDTTGQQRLARDILELIARFDRGGGRTMGVPGEYVAVAIT